MLLEQDYIKDQGSLKDTYEHYLGIYNLERTASDMWDMVFTHKIQSLFQMEKQSGVQGIALTHPTSVDDLAVLNSVIRLMAQEKGDEQPLEKYARFKNNINLWYQEMDRHGLTQEEQDLLKEIVGPSYGIAESQEKIMSLVQLPQLGGFSLGWADSLRKAVAKKQPEAYLELEKEFFTVTEEKGCSHNLCYYVWRVLIAMSRGYSFNLSHTLAYSLVALQEMNLAYQFPIIFWNCACLITDSGGTEEEDEGEIVDIFEPEDFDEFEYIDAPDKKTKLKKKRAKVTDYKKIATAIGKMQQAGITVEPPNINTSSYTYTPNVEENKIIYGLSGILRVGAEDIAKIIAERPYKSPRDFLNRVKPKRQVMISLIKGGAFDEMMDRKTCMAWYIWETCDKKKRLTLQNMPGLIQHNILPTDGEYSKSYKIYEFNRYLKACCKISTTTYQLDDRAIEFLISISKDDLIQQDDSVFLLNANHWNSVYQVAMDKYRAWIANDKENILKQLNESIFLNDWQKYSGKNNLSSWEMEALSFYYHEHELANVNYDRYGIVNFFDLPEDPEVERSFNKGGRTINMFKLYHICGTCIAKDKNKSTVTLLTPEGVVNVKFRKEHMALFDKQISGLNDKGDKKILERSWFNRGEMVLLQGFRSGDNFIPKKYKAFGGPHTLYKIIDVSPEGSLELTTNRYQGGNDE